MITIYFDEIVITFFFEFNLKVIKIRIKDFGVRFVNNNKFNDGK